MNYFGWGILGLLTSILVAIFRAWILTKLWVWFIVPLFGLPPLTVVQAYAVILVSAFFKKTTYVEDHREPARIFFTDIFTSVCSACLVLFIGWFIHAYLW